jgi:hypothetical protein
LGSRRKIVQQLPLGEVNIRVELYQPSPEQPAILLSNEPFLSTRFP